MHDGNFGTRAYEWLPNSEKQKHAPDALILDAELAQLRWRGSIHQPNSQPLLNEPILLRAGTSPWRNTSNYKVVFPTCMNDGLIQHHSGQRVVVNTLHNRTMHSNDRLG